MKNSIKKIKALEVFNITNLVNNIKGSICDQYIKEFSFMLDGGCANKNIFIGSCIPLNYLLCEKLKENGFNAKIVAGQATFGVNENQFGVVDYGGTGNMPTLTPDGNLYYGVGFLGHCWITVEKLDLVIDLSLMHLKDIVLEDNRHRGIDDCQYSLDLSKLVLSSDEIIERDKIISGAIGYHYKQDAGITNEAIAKIEKLKTLAISS